MSQPPSKKRKQAMKLVVTGVRGDDPIFAKTTFEIKVFLENDDGEIQSDQHDLPLDASLHFDDEQEEQEEEPQKGTLEVLEDVVVRKGKAVLKCKINEVSMNVRNRKFVIQLKPAAGKKGDGVAQSISAVRTTGIEVVNQRLEIDTSGWSNEFYKDYGSRDKCMIVPVKLVNSQGVVVTGRSMKLHCTLLYENGIAATNQEILRMHESCTPMIKTETGTAELKLRIEAVSRNHENQDFQIQIGPYPSSHEDKDTASTMTPSVKVLSKKNHRRNKTESLSKRKKPGNMEVDTTTAHFSAIGNIVPPIGPDANSDTSSSMGSLLQWIKETLDTLQRNQMVMDDLQEKSRQQHEEIKRVLTTYQNKTMTDLQVIITALGVDESNGDSGDGNGGATGTDAASGGHLVGSAKASSLSSSSSLPDPLSTSSTSLRNQRRPSAVVAAELPNSANSLSGFGVPSEFGGLMRQTSNSYFDASGEMPNQNAAGLQYVSALPASETSGIEAQIAYVVAKIFVATNKKMGFPAFSTSKELLGFYQAADDADSINAVHEKMEFLPLDHARKVIKLSTSNIEASSKSLEKEITRKSSSVKQKMMFGSIEEMKVAALLYHTNKTGSSVIGDDDLPEMLDELMADKDFDMNWNFTDDQVKL
jgi:hypothetical protein